MKKSQLNIIFRANSDDDSCLSDDDGRSKGSTTIATGTNTTREEDRDEVKEIQKMSRTENRLIRTWRVILLVLLVVTAAAVSSITYVLLRREEHAAYKATVRTLSITTKLSRCETVDAHPCRLRYIL
jgi:hypothetical protein